MGKLLLLEDDISLVDGLGYSLEKNGFDWELARTVKEALDRLQGGGGYDLLLLDVTLPDGTGYEVCEAVRKRGDPTPIIFLTASDEEVNIIRGLDCGGDDYITKPFRLGELCSRIRALLRRAGMSAKEGMSAGEGISAKEEMSVREGMPFKERMPNKEGISVGERMSAREGISAREEMPVREGMPFRERITAREGISVKEGIPAREKENVILCGMLRIDLFASRVFLDGRPVDLTGAEYRLLCLLARNAGCTVTRERILQELWDDGGNYVDDNTVSVYVRRLREKLEKDPSRPEHLMTVRGFGYRWKEKEVSL